MMKRLVSVFTLVFLDGFVLISMAAVALAIATQIQVGDEMSFGPVYILLFSGTMVSYNWHRILKTGGNGKMLFPDSNRLSFVMLLIATPMVVFALFRVNIPLLEVLAPLAFVTFLYSLPTQWKLGFFPVRKIPHIKVFLVAATWSFVTVILPLAGNFVQYNHFLVLLIFTGRFLLFLAVTIPFDIRDTETDRIAGILTLPVVIGKEKAKRIAILSILLFPLASIVQAIMTGMYNLPLADLMTAAIVLGLLRCKNCWEKPCFYTFFLDGALIIYGMLVFSVWYFCY